MSKQHPNKSKRSYLDEETHTRVSGPRFQRMYALRAKKERAEKEMLAKTSLKDIIR